jgi:hypothetical protein
MRSLSGCARHPDLDLVSQKTERTHEDVAEKRVAQVPDMGSLVGVDVGVLNDDLPALPRARSGPIEQARRDAAAVDQEVDIAAGLDPGLANAFRQNRGRGDLRRDHPGRFAELAREVEGRGGGEVSEGDAGRPFQDDPLELHAVQ